MDDERTIYWLALGIVATYAILYLMTK